VGLLFATIAVPLLVGFGFGLGVAFGLRYWSRDLVILRARRRELRQLARGRRRLDRLERL
jgi:hypothetical protein